jgi:hypothetical protein
MWCWRRRRPTNGDDDSSSFPADSPFPQPVVVLNPLHGTHLGPAADFEVAYHLRYLSVQYMSNTSTLATLRQFGLSDGDGGQ